MAKLALIKEGMNFATKQIAAGISAFAPVLTEELHVFRTFLLTHEVEEEEDADDEESLNGDGDGDENDNIIEFLGGNASDLAVGSATGNAILQALSTLSVPVLDPVFPEVLAPGVSCWKFPKEISQGFYKGRNGSNACSLISILLGYALSFLKSSAPGVPIMYCKCHRRGIVWLYRNWQPSLQFLSGEFTFKIPLNPRGC